MLFEIIYDFRVTRVVTSTFLLSASPFVEVLLTSLLDLATTRPNDTTRAGAGYGVVMMQTPNIPLDPMPLVRSGNPELINTGLRIAGHAGHQVPEQVWDTLITQHQHQWATLYYLGMANHPQLKHVATNNPNQPIRNGANWWLTQGPRITR
jgi:hypothetical protein